MSQTRYPSKSWAFKSCFSFKVRKHGQQQVYLQYKVCWILSKMVGAHLFSQLYLRTQPPLQSPPEIRSSTSFNVWLPILPLLIQKIIWTFPTNTLFLYTSAIFYVPIFAYNHPNNIHQKCFLYLSHWANSGCVMRPRN